MVLEKEYSDFISVVNSRNIKITFHEDSTYYHLVARDGIVFYETYVRKNGSSDQLDFENNYLAQASQSFPDGAIPVISNSGLFTKPYTNLIVLSKNEYGDPVTIKSVYHGVDAQLVTIVYDEDGDLQSANVSNL